MNRPRRPSQPFRRRPSGPPPGTAPGGAFVSRRRSALDLVPQDLEPPFEVLGTGVDRLALQAGAQLQEMVVLQGFTREIEEAFQKWKGRPDDFWGQHPELIEKARKLDELLGQIQARK